jgi:hypothetical protein
MHCTPKPSITGTALRRMYIKNKANRHRMPRHCNHSSLERKGSFEKGVCVYDADKKQAQETSNQSITSTAPRKAINVSKDMLNLGVQLGVEEIVGGILFTKWMAE